MDGTIERFPVAMDAAARGGGKSWADGLYRLRAGDHARVQATYGGSAETG